MAKILGRIVHGTQATGRTNWYTPSMYVESARKVMGSIDLDPASCAMANRTVMAGKYFDEDDDGLSKPWSGNVWLNPPYASFLMNGFVGKLLSEIASGSVSQAVLLTHNNTDTAWFHRAVRECRALCFTKGRVRFYNEEGSPNSPTHGHTFMFFSRGTRAKFVREFSRYGFCLEAI